MQSAKTFTAQRNLLRWQRDSEESESESARTERLRATVRPREGRVWEQQWEHENERRSGRRRNGERCRVRECDWEWEQRSRRALQSEKWAFRILKISHFPRWHKIFIFFPTSAVSTGDMQRSSVNLTLLLIKRKGIGRCLGEYVDPSVYHKLLTSINHHCHVESI